MQVAVESQRKVQTTPSSVAAVILKDITAENFVILGEEQHVWVEGAVKNCTYKTVDYDGSVDVKQIVKPLLTSALYTLVLFSNTPLLTTSTVEDIIDYITIKDVNACKLPSGYAFKTEYLKVASEIMFDSFYMKNEQDFFELETMDDLPVVADTLQKRIFQYHLESGVTILQPATTYIQPWVAIQKGTVIHGGVVLKGSTKIGRNCHIHEFSKITDSEIAGGVETYNCEIEDSVIFENCTVKQFSYISNTIVEKNITIPPHSALIDTRVER